MSDHPTPAQSAPEAERPTGPIPDPTNCPVPGCTLPAGHDYSCAFPTAKNQPPPINWESRARAAEEELERVRGHLWYCASCRDWKPTILQAGDMVCACGYIVASYRDRAGSQGEERSEGACPSCSTPLSHAPGIGPYCPNKACDRIDDVGEGP